ncbi:MAG: hypothetical protein ACYTFV_13410 [Planctomycetota bacterium]
MAPPRPRRKERPTFPCPNCSADVPVGATFCRECGSDETTGWSEETLYDGLDLPDPSEGLAPVEIPDTFAEYEILVARGRTRWRLGFGILLLVLTFLMLLF